ATVMGTSFDMSSTLALQWRFGIATTASLRIKWQAVMPTGGTGLHRTGIAVSMTSVPLDDSSKIVESPEESELLLCPIGRRGRTAGPHGLRTRARQERPRVQVGLHREAPQSRACRECRGSECHSVKTACRHVHRLQRSIRSAANRVA